MQALRENDPSPCTLFSCSPSDIMVIFLIAILIVACDAFNPPCPHQNQIGLHHRVQWTRFIALLSTRLSLEKEFSDAALNSIPKNVLGTALQSCCLEPRTGFYRDGFCRAGPRDTGRFVVQGKFSPAERHICAAVTDEFLSFTLSRGNDLIHPQPIFGFYGLRPGDRWCIW